MEDEVKIRETEVSNSSIIRKNKITQSHVSSNLSCYMYNNSLYFYLKGIEKEKIKSL